MILADSYFPVYFFLGPMAAIASLLVAIMIEVPLLRFTWRLPIKRLLAPILLANLTSALVGVMPAVRHAVLVGISVDSDPLETYRLYWHNQISLASTLLAITLGTELCVYLLFKWLRRWPVSRASICVGTLLANFASYALLVGYMFTHLEPALSPGCTLHPNTSWVRSNGERVWFIDSESGHLCSIRLNGTDRRQESQGKLPQGKEFWLEELGAYALVPDRKAVLYTDQDFRWWVNRNGREIRLPLVLPEDLRRYPVERDDIWPSVEQALGAAQLAPATQANSQPDPTVFFYARRQPWQMEASGADLRAVTTYLPDGSGSGIPLRVEHGRDGKALNFGVSNGLLTLACAEPAILEHEKLILFRCGGWIMVLDPETRRVGRLVRGTSMVLQSPAFGPPVSTRPGMQARTEPEEHNGV